jgi:DNA end-binding protein Ku
VSILAIRGILRAETLRFNDEVRTPPSISLPSEDAHPTKEEIQRFEAAISKGISKTLDREEMRDEYADGMLRLIESKSSERRQKVRGKPSGKPLTPGPSRVIDIMEVLKQSLVEKEVPQRTR